MDARTTTAAARTDTRSPRRMTIPDKFTEGFFGTIQGIWAPARAVCHRADPFIRSHVARTSGTWENRYGAHSGKGSTGRERDACGTHSRRTDAKRSGSGEDILHSRSTVSEEPADDHSGVRRNNGL